MSTMLANIAIAWTRAWGEGETAAFEKIAAPDYVRHSKTGEEDLDVVLRQIEEFHQAFTDFDVEILHAVEDYDLIAIHWRSAGRHTGEFMGVPPTDRNVSVNGATFIKHSEERITQEWTVWDPRELLSAMNIWHLGSRAGSRA